MTHQSCTVYTEGRLEVGGFMEVVLEAFAHGMTVGPNEIRLHLCLTDHPIPGKKKSQNKE